MELLEAILHRRTIKDFKPDTVSADVLERALSAGRWAQNHRLTEPWRFTVLGPETHRRLAEAHPDAAGKLLSKPLIVAASQRLGDPAQRQEDYGAMACAIQNIQLAAWADSLGMQWSSGKIIRLPQTYAVLGLRAEEEEIVGLLFFGYPERIPAPQPRKPLAEVSRWLA